MYIIYIYIYIYLYQHFYSINSHCINSNNSYSINSAGAHPGSRYSFIMQMAMGRQLYSYCITKIICLRKSAVR